MPLDFAIRRRFAEVIEASGREMKGLSLAANLGETYVRDTIERDRGAEGGIRKVLRSLRPGDDALIRYVIEGEGCQPDSWEDYFQRTEPTDKQFATTSSIVSVKGRIGAGAEILTDFEELGPDGLFEIEVPMMVAPDDIAFEVDGNSMWPRYKAGDVIICNRQGVAADADIVGWEAAVRTEEGRRFVKEIRAGSAPGYFTLESHNAEPMFNVRLVWVSEVAQIVRAKRWRAVNRAAGRR